MILEIKDSFILIELKDRPMSLYYCFFIDKLHKPQKNI